MIFNSRFFSMFSRMSWISEPVKILSHSSMNKIIQTRREVVRELLRICEEFVKVYFPLYACDSVLINVRGTGGSKRDPHPLPFPVSERLAIIFIEGG